MSYSLQITEYPEPLDLLEALKSHLRLNNGNAEDTELMTFLETAKSVFEFQSKRTLLPTTFRQPFENWVCPLELARGQVTEIVSVSYYDYNDTLQTVTTYPTNSNGYRADLTGFPALIYLPNSYPPALSSKRVRPVIVEYVAGEFEDTESLPNDIRLAILLLAAHYYNYRESHTTDSLNDLPEGFKRIADKYNTGIGGY